MKRIARQFTYPGACAVAAAALLAALATPSRASAADPAQAAAAGTRPTHTMLAQAGSTPAPAATEQAPAQAPAAKPKTSRADHVEARINELHAKLKIAPEQEELWTKVTQVMRDNAKTMEERSKARAEKAKTMTAVEDLKSYGEITDVHAEGIKAFVSAFEPLYDSMSDAQKKNADSIFRHRLARRSRRTRTASKQTQPSPNN